MTNAGWQAENTKGRSLRSTRWNWRNTRSRSSTVARPEVETAASIVSARTKASSASAEPWWRIGRAPTRARPVPGSRRGWRPGRRRRRRGRPPWPGDRVRPGTEGQPRTRRRRRVRASFNSVPWGSTGRSARRRGRGFGAAVPASEKAGPSHPAVWRGPTPPWPEGGCSCGVRARDLLSAIRPWGCKTPSSHVVRHLTWSHGAAAPAGAGPAEGRAATTSPQPTGRARRCVPANGTAHGGKSRRR